MRQSLDGRVWVVRAMGDAHERVRGREFEAVVPGCVHTDLIRARVIEHPDVGMTEREIQWVGRTTWRYGRSFDVEASVREHEHIDLVFEGLDTFATVRLNGVELGRAANMHHPHRFDVRGHLRDGENTVEVEFAPPMDFAEAEHQRLGTRPVNADGDWGPYHVVRKMACNYGWDWGPKAATSGIWRSVRLEGWSTARLDDVRPLVESIENDVARVCVHAGAVGATDELVVDVSISGPDGRTFATTVDAGAVATVEIDQGMRWWPRGMGAQPLYDVDVTLRRAGAVFDSWRGRIGLRTVRLDLAEEPDGGARFALVVNGRAVFCRGANWIPEGLFPSALNAADYRARVTQAADANMNVLRVWGGGIYEDEAFYDACDELGVLVWQDFMFACAMYPEEEPLRSSVEAEAKFNITRLSRHPSVVLWCGGNECLTAWQRWGWKEQLPPGRTWGVWYWTDLLPRLLGALDATRPYWANSPYSGRWDLDAQEVDRGTRHTWDLRMDGYRDNVPRFVAEFGHQAPPCLSTLREAAGEGLSLDGEWMTHRQRATLANDFQFEEPLAATFAPTDDVDRWHYLTQLLQARSIAGAISWLRAHRGRCMGAIFWQLNDAWSGHSWSCIDVKGRRKLLWHAAKRVCAPVLLTIEPLDGRPCAVLINDGNQTVAGGVRVRRVGFDGTVHAAATFDADTAPDTVQSFDLASLGEPDDPCAELLEARFDRHSAFWWFAPDKDLRLPAAEMNVSTRDDEGRVVVDVEATTVVRDLVLRADIAHPEAVCETQLVTLLPGERARMVVIGVPPGGDRATLTRSPALVSVNQAYEPLTES